MGQQKRRILTSAVLGLGAALVVAGCGAGQITQTDTQEPAVNGAFAQVGRLVVRDASLAFPTGEHGVYPPGSNAPLKLTIINQGATDDELLSIQAQGAQPQVAYEGSRAVVAGATLRIENTAETQAEHAGHQPAQPPTGEAPPAGEEGTQVGKARAVVQGLTNGLYPGQILQVTLNFRDAGPVTIGVPIGHSTRPRPEAPEGEHGGHGAPEQH
ncbi:hypothetical protein [Amycolatopsis suaedae]|uniref:Copper chaperone PCu(A)C n=1 Tax=Amycolatopsis suaedae TaxID=2510978 RepID=A0A4Q7J4T6_9PSEU|nr:hypothetical protein [Amycolatopsis suaedae]RZQ61682.1 hypothetical protein EWH70_22230 [Amycolatopsis suaedae]